MTTNNLKPLIESAILTLEQTIENKTRMARMCLQTAPGANHIYGDHKQVLSLRLGLCGNINMNQVGNLDLHPQDPSIVEFEILAEELSLEWPGSSGSNGYPVPMPEHFNLDWERYSEPDQELDEHDEKEKAYAAYHTCFDECVNMYTDDYGELRFQLAEYLLGKLKEKLREINSKT